MEISKKNWGKTSLNEDVFIYTLKNDFLEVEILNYGGIIKSIKMPNHYGIMENIVLSMENIYEYEKFSPYFGAIIGRNAGRIKNASFEIDGSSYSLNKNNGNNNIHGGIANFSHKIWNAKKYEEDNKLILELDLFSPHLEEGFPGNINVKVRYILDQNKLHIEYLGKTDRKTFLNLTNHSYFNLSGERKRNILDEELFINADKFIKVDPETLPNEIKKLDNNIMDFRKPKKFYKLFIKDDENVEIVGRGLDHPFILNKDNLKPAIILYDEISKRKLEINTTENVMVVYSGNFLQETKTTKTLKFEKYSGIAFEAQNYPDALNFIKEKANLIDENHDYIQKTTYKFTLGDEK